MKNRIIVLVLYSFFMMVFQAVRGQNNGNMYGDLTIIISGLKNNKGDVKIGLYNSEESWIGNTEKYRGNTININNKRAEWVIKSIPYGEYAIKFFHDENGDDKINGNLIGIPIETYGFYLCGKSKYIPPTFNAAKFLFNSGKMRIEIKINE